MKVEEKTWYLWIKENMSGGVMQRKLAGNVKPFCEITLKLPKQIVPLK